MKRWFWFGGGIILFLLALFLAVAAGERRQQRVIAYQGRLNDLTEELIELTMPLAEAFSQGRSPDDKLVAETIMQLQTVQIELDALGQPPDELVQPHATLITAVSSYEEAFVHLAVNLEASTFPFDEAFLAAAVHGGESIHQVTAELANVSITTHCKSLAILLPNCWLWP